MDGGFFSNQTSTEQELPPKWERAPQGLYFWAGVQFVHFLLWCVCEQTKMLLLSEAFKMFCHYSGLSYIAAKATSNKNEDDHPTLVLWLLGLYIATFGLASQRYENQLDRLENKVNLLVSQTGSDDTRMAALSRIPQLQKVDIPLEPDLFNPISVWCTLLCAKEINNETVEELKNIVISFKEDLSKTLLFGVDLTDANLLGVNLNFADLRFADASGANLIDATLVETNFFEAIFRHALLNGASMSRANLVKADLFGANLSGAYIGHAAFIEADLFNANLSGAYLGEADLSRADLSNADLSSADFSSADLTGAKLTRAGLSWADFTRADFSGSDLSDADLSNANLTMAVFSGADLSGAHFSNADFSGARLLGATVDGIRLKKAKGNVHTILPEAVAYPDSWLTKDEIEQRDACREIWRPYLSKVKRCGAKDLEWTKEELREL